MTRHEQLREKLETMIQKDFVPGDKFLTQRDIMERFAVSFSTVERALRELVNSGMLTRKQGSGTFVSSIESVAPSAAANSRIALVLTRNVTHIPHTFYAEILFEIGDRLSEQDYSLSYIYADHQLGYQELQNNLKNRFCGAVLIGAITEELIGAVAATNLPFVVVDSRIDLPGVCYIVGQNEQGASDAVTYLLQNGHRRIGFVSTPLHTTFLERFLGYCNALATAGVPVEQTLTVKNFHFKDEELDGLLAAKPTAIFAANDTMAVFVCRSLKKRGIRVPEDISIVGFDGDYTGEQNHPRLTTVTVPRRQMGRTAVECLMQKIAGQTPPPVILPVTFQAEESVAKI